MLQRFSVFHVLHVLQPLLFTFCTCCNVLHVLQPLSVFHVLRVLQPLFSTFCTCFNVCLFFHVLRVLQRLSCTECHRLNACCGPVLDRGMQSDGREAVHRSKQFCPLSHLGDDEIICRHYMEFISLLVAYGSSKSIDR